MPEVIEYNIPHSTNSFFIELKAGFFIKILLNKKGKHSKKIDDILKRFNILILFRLNSIIKNIIKNITQAAIDCLISTPIEIMEANRI